MSIALFACTHARASDQEKAIAFDPLKLGHARGHIRIARNDPVISSYGGNPELPVYKIEDENILISEVQSIRARRTEVFHGDRILQTVESDSVPARSFRVVVGDDLDDLFSDRPTAHTSVRVSAGSDGIFNLWSVDESNADATYDVVACSFAIESARERTVYLGVGFDFSCIILVNGRPVYGRIGDRNMVDSSDLVAAKLDAGINVVSLVHHCRGQKGKGYYTPQWTAKVRIFIDKDGLVAHHFNQTRHPFDAPIAKSARQLRLTVGGSFCHTAKLMTIDDRVVATGTVDLSGNIAWDKDPPSDVHLFLGSVDDRLIEPIVILGDNTLEEVAHSLATPKWNGDVSGAWRYRLSYLLRAEHLPIRKSAHWNQQFAYALLNAQPQETVTHWAGVASGYVFESFPSSLDGSEQLYMYYIPRKLRFRCAEPDERSNLVVVVPGVSHPVRPILEGWLFWAATEFENWTTAADENNCVLLWPGYTDVDYGRELSVGALSECIKAFLGKHGSNYKSTYLFAACSAAPAAFEYAKTNSDMLTGMLLYAPVFRRNGIYRYTPGFVPEYLRSSKLSEPPSHIDDLGRKLAGLQFGTIFDTSAPGHGDRASLDEFSNAVRNSNGNVTEFAFPVSDETVWGERVKARFRALFRFVEKSNHKKSEPKQGASPSLAPPSSIKQVLASGFYIKSQLPPDDPWYQLWNRRYGTWRNASLPLTRHARSDVEVRLLEYKTVEELKAALPEVANNLPDKYQGEPLFGMCQAAQEDQPCVTIFRLGDSVRQRPQVDPLLDGYFRGCLWSFENNQWRLKATW